jgi:hypothetical protein
MSCREAAKLLLVAKQPTGLPDAYQEARTVISGENGKADIVLIDSASLVRPEDAGAVIIAGSHGGLVGGKPEMALQVDALAGIFHDAGVGMDGAGLTRLDALDKRGIAAATVSASSARIGDAVSIYEDGIISHLNETARHAGGEIGQTCRAFAAVLQAS